MATTLKLANGLRVACGSRLEARILYSEIFEARCYFRHGIDVPADGVVVDVGANIGMLGLYLSREVPGATVHMLEPIPDTFALLERNVKEMGEAFRVAIHRVGAGAGNGTAEFEFDPGTTFAATMRPDVVTASALTDAPAADWAEALLLDLHLVYPRSRLARIVGSAIRARWIRPLALRAAGLLIRVSDKARVARTRRVECRIVRLSDFLREQSIDRVDLLKIDVEGGEWDVLEGIYDEDWPRLRQLVIEVHTVAGRLEQLLAMLERRGYITAVEPEEWAMHRMLGITTVFARREPTT